MQLNNNPLVTIAIPMFNAEATIVDAVKSVFVQTYQNWELILLDDGSKDKTLEIVRDLKDSRIRIVTDGQNKGLVFRLNQIPSLANGDYLARMDADDMMVPTRIEKQIRLLISEPAIDLVDAGTFSITEQGEPAGIRGLNEINYNPSHILNNAMLLHASIVGKKQWFIDNPYNAEYVRAEDRELWIRTYKFSKFARIKEPLYIVREGKVSIKNYVSSMRTIKRILLEHGPEILSSSQLKIELLKIYAKINLYRVTGFFRLQHLISKHRNQSLNDEDLDLATAVLTEIRSVKLEKN